MAAPMLDPFVRPALVLSLLLSAGVTAVACSSDPAGTADTGDAATASDASGSDAAAASDAPKSSDGGGTDSATADSAVACNMLALDGVPVATLSRVTTPAPTPTGGTVPDGNYHVREGFIHGATSSPAVPILRTRLNAKGTVWQSVSGDADVTSTKPPKNETLEVVPTGNAFTLTPKCPVAKAAMTYTYSVSQSDAGKTEIHYFGTSAGSSDVTELVLEKE
jgi:hypothetical protein